MTGRVAGINTQVRLVSYPLGYTRPQVLWAYTFNLMVHIQILLEIRITPGAPGLDVSFKSERTDLAVMTFEALGQVLAAQ